MSRPSYKQRMRKHVAMTCEIRCKQLFNIQYRLAHRIIPRLVKNDLGCYSYCYNIRRGEGEEQERDEKRLGSWIEVATDRRGASSWGRWRGPR